MPSECSSKIWREPGAILEAFSQVILIFGDQEDGNDKEKDLREKLKMSKCKLNLKLLNMNNPFRVKHCF